VKSLLAVLAALATFSPAAASAVDVWVTHSTEKIQANASARTTAAARIAAARDEFEAFQVVVTGSASNVRATATDLTGPGKIGNVRLYREALMNITSPSGADGAIGEFPDGLVPDVDETYGERRNAFPFTVPAGESRAIWVEVLVPADAAAGDYTGTVHVTWDGGAKDVPVTLTVWPFTLPSSASLKTAFGFTWGALNSAFGVSSLDDIAALRDLYNRFALDHRLTLSHIDDGGGNDMTHFASVYGPSIDGTAATHLPGAKMTAVEMMGDVGTWSPFFAQRGWSDRLFQYTCDEPPLTCAWSDIPTRAAAAHGANPSVRTLVTTTIQEATAQGVLSSIDILVPVINYLDDKSGSTFTGEQRGNYDSWLAGSAKRELWTYESCMSHGCGGGVNFGNPSASDLYFTGWPSYAIDATAVRNRALEWLSFRYHLTGELYYETVEAFRADPWTSQWAFGGNGDGTLFYPGTTARIGGSHPVPVASIRLKMIREGMEDYEYLKLLSDLGGEADAQAIAANLFPHAYDTAKSADDLFAARAQLAALIVKRSGGGGAGSIAGSGGAAGDGSSGIAAVGSVHAGSAGCGTGGGFGLAALLGLTGALRLRRRRSR
jgi:glycosyl hydrolase family 123